MMQIDLEEFVGFAIKVVMQSKRTVEPCAIRAFRSIALASKKEGHKHLVKDDFSKAVINTDKDALYFI